MSKNNKKKNTSICFVALNGFNIIDKSKNLEHIGGAEVQLGIIAKWLARNGFKVSLITLDHGQEDGQNYEGIVNYKSYITGRGIPFLRFLHPQLTMLLRALKSANADMYYQRGADICTGIIAIWCKFKRKKFVFATASPNDCKKRFIKTEKNKFSIATVFERIIFLIGLRFADLMIVQTEGQRKSMAKNQGLSTIIFRNVGMPEVSTSAPSKSNKNGDQLTVLWVGRIAKVKRFEIMIDVAKKCEHIKFNVVGAYNIDTPYAKKLFEEATKIQNIELHGYVPNNKMDRYYRDNDILCCTSLFEGFPNTFIEAWMHGKAVLTTYDPDNIVSDNKLGWVSTTSDEIAMLLNEIIHNRHMLEDSYHSIKRYYKQNHDLNVNLPRFVNILKVGLGNSTKPSQG